MDNLVLFLWATLQILIFLQEWCQKFGQNGCLILIFLQKYCHVKNLWALKPSENLVKVFVKLPRSRVSQKVVKTAFLSAVSILSSRPIRRQSGIHSNFLRMGREKWNTLLIFEFRGRGWGADLSSESQLLYLTQSNGGKGEFSGFFSQLRMKAILENLSIVL